MLRFGKHGLYIINILSDFCRFNKKATIERHSHSVCSHRGLYLVSYHLLAFQIIEECELLI